MIVLVNYCLILFLFESLLGLFGNIICVLIILLMSTDRYHPSYNLCDEKISMRKCFFTGNANFSFIYLFFVHIFMIIFAGICPAG